MTVPQNSTAGQLLPFRQPAAAAQDEILFAIADLTPDDARRILEKNFARNRKIRRARVERYKAQMASGEWPLTHQAIALDHDGMLIDGQHRMTALSEMPEGTKVRMAVARYTRDTRALAALDIGGTRLACDVLTVEGIASRNASRDAASVAHSIAMGVRRSSNNYDHQTILNTYVAFQQEIDWAIEHVTGKRIIAPVAAAFAYAYPTDRVRVAAIAERVRTQVGLLPNSGELAIRSYIDNGLHSKNNGGVVRGPQAHRLEVFYKILTGLRAAVSNKTLGKLQAPRDVEGLPMALAFFADRRRNLNLTTGIPGA